MAKFGVEDVLFLDHIAAHRPLSTKVWEESKDRYQRFLDAIENPDDFADAMAVLDDRRGGMLASFGGWLATHAIQHHAPEDIRPGLVACALDYMVTKDWRDHMYCLARLARACERLDRDIDEEFLRAAEIVGPTTGQYGKADAWLLSFASRTAEGRAYTAFGEVEEGSGHTFRFRPIGELLTELVQVIPVAQCPECDGATIMLISVERYTDGFLVLFRLMAGDGKGRLGQLTFPWDTAVDDQGRRYTPAASATGPTFFGGDPRAHREAALFTPPLPNDVQWVRFALPVVRRIDWIRQGSATTGMRYTDVLSGPWTFTVAVLPI